MRRLAALALLSAAARLTAATFTVTNTNDSGAGSLRQAILDANGNAGADVIHFAILGSDPGCDGSGVCTIAPATQLPQINETVTIDGYTQPGASVNTATFGSNAVLKVVISGTNIPGAQGLVLSSAGSTVRGLVIDGGLQNAINSFDESPHIEGCYFGLDASGHSASTVGYGVFMEAETTGGAVIGGPALAQRNVFGAATEGAIYAYGTKNCTIQNNLIALDATGTVPMSEPEGILLGTGSAGQPGVISDNVFGGYTQIAIDLQAGSPGTIVKGNHIGVDASGTVAFPRLPFTAGISVAVSAIIGGVNPGDSNVITGAVTGVSDNFAGSTMRGNSIYGNGTIGIDTGLAGISPNDPGDSDGAQNFPLVKSVTTGASTHVTGVLHSAPSTTYDIDFYSNPACTNFPHDFLQGQTYLGSTQVTTDGSGDASIDAVVPAATEAGARVSMTATNTANGHTSEFSQRLPFSVTPASGPAAGGAPFTVSGTDFAAGATVVISGAAASGVAVSNDHTITANAPALSAGSVNDLVVTNTDGTTGTLVKGWVSDFLDVNGGNQFYSFVTTLVSNTITVGVGGGNYGVDAPTLRQQMAVFLLKAEHGLCYSPPACSGVFADVPCSSNFAPWIEQMAAEGITGGCGNGNFCPTNPVRRDQMAVFLLKGEHGSSYAPPACAGTFADVPCPSTFANWIEQLAAEQITGGCGGGNYCPQNNNTRGQMAVFITKTFHLQ